MNYYIDIVEKIEKAISENNYNLASKLIDDELNAPYVPKDVFDKLNILKAKLPYNETNSSLNDEKIIEYLNGSFEKQLIAVEQLNKKNLRDYLDICNAYLSKEGFINAKVLLIYSLIEQEISEEINYNNNGINYCFIPKFCLLPNESLGFKKANKLIEDKFMKDPSLMQMSKSLLYKECLLALPLTIEEDEASDLADKIINYVNKAITAK